MPLGSLRPQLFRKVTIIGVGLMGGSLGLAIKKHRLAREVVGLSQRHASLQTALKNHAIDQGYHDTKKAVANADLVILSTPVGIIKGMLSMIGPYLKRGCIVTDVGSVKAPIVNIAQANLPGSVCFVGSHPLAGSEKRGVQYATDGLFVNSMCLMTPTEKTNRTACDKVKRLWTKIGAEVKFLSPEKHDKILSYTSHLPHILAYALMGTVPSDCLEYAANGLKDTTRIASSSPQMWNDICMSNPRNILTALDELVKILSAFRKSISTAESKILLDRFKVAKEKRDGII